MVRPRGVHFRFHPFRGWRWTVVRPDGLPIRGPVVVPGHGHVVALCLTWFSDRAITGLNCCLRDEGERRIGGRARRLFVVMSVQMARKGAA